MKLLYITQWFEPEPMIKGKKFVQGLIGAGYNMKVLTGIPNYPEGKIYAGYKLKILQSEIIDQIEVVRVPLYPSHDHSSFKRILNYMSFFFSSALYASTVARGYDVIYAYHPPMSVGLSAIVAGALRRVPVVLEVQDLWPDTVLSSGMPGVSRLYRPLDWMCRTVYRRSCGIIAQSRGIRAKLIERGVPENKVVAIANWADETLLEPSGTFDLTNYKLEGRFNLVYGGNLGQAQALATVIRAAKLAASRAPDLRVLLVGDGIEAEQLKALAREIKADNVELFPRVGTAAATALFRAADALLLHLADREYHAITIPSKTQTYLACARPILAGARGETADIITEAGAGLAVAPEDPEAMADAMVSLCRMPPDARNAMGARGQAYYEEHFAFRAAIDATSAALEAFVRGKGVTTAGIGQVQLSKHIASRRD